MAKLLLVDDDTELTTVIAGYLSQQNFAVEVVGDGRAALDVLAVSGYDVIILDLNMPHVGGIEVCKRLRAAHDRTPIIMLTGKSSVDERSEGLDCGADDYLTKPFSLKELASRIKALLRRSNASFSTTLKCGDLELDSISHTVTQRGAPLHLMPVDFALLEFFMSHPLQVFSNDTLLARVWTSHSESTDEAVRSAVRRLRQKIDDGAGESASYIENHRRIGYRFRPDRRG